MFKRKSKIISNQVNEIADLKETEEDLRNEISCLESKILNLIGQVDDAEENTLLILDYIQYILERNNYNNEEMQRRSALEYIKDMKSNIEEKGLENIIELVYDYQSKN